MKLDVRAAVIDGQTVPGDVMIDDGLIVQVGVRPAGGSGLAVPGYIDLQVNGFAGADFNATDIDGYRIAGTALVATGVTAYQPTLISQPLGSYWKALEVAEAAIEEDRGDGPRILGVHLEGPFLSPDHCGAHDPTYMLDPDLDLVDELCATGVVTYMTVAPELPGGLDLVTHLVARDITVSLGHSGADAATAHAAYNIGARAVTHLHNAQHRWSHRDPGLPGVALTRRDVTVQAIVDLIHLAPETVQLATTAARGRFAAVTDAIAATGMGPGTYRLGDRDVVVADQDARLPDGTLAGSLLSLDRAVRNLVDLDVPRAEAIASVTHVPARLIGRPELGTLRPGTTADIAVLDDDLHVTRTLIDGTVVFNA